MVQLYVTASEYDYRLPWAPPAQTVREGSGFIIEGNRILTCAHGVSNVVSLQVQRNQSSKRYRASVEWIGHDCDLAIVKVDDEMFFHQITPLEIGEEMALMRDEVDVFGYPIGGETLSVTRGILSRTEMQQYAHGLNVLLCSQIDSAINDGNSGGPVVCGGKVVGVVHQGFSMEGQSMGYMIPVPIIRHFLEGIERGEYRGIPFSGVSFNPMENPVLRSCFGMDETQTGVMIKDVAPTSPCYDVLLPRDILLAVEGMEVGNSGKIFLEGKHWVLFDALFNQKHEGEVVHLRVLREHEELSLSIALDRPPRDDCPAGQVEYDKPPTYLIKGGLLFQPLNLNYLSAWEDYLRVVLDLYCAIQTKSRDEEIVMLTRVLPDEVNLGYEGIMNEIVVSVNGQTIDCMADLVKAFETNTDDTYRVVTKGSYIALDAASVNSKSCRLLNQYGIFSECSDDLKKVE